MKKTELMTKATRMLHKAGFQLKKHSPEILITVGAIGAVTSTILACKSTLKVNEVIDEAKTNIDDIHEATENGKTKAGKDYSIEDSKKDLTIVYAQTGVKLVKLYAPAVALGVASIGCMFTSHNILRKRNVALAAAYTAVDKGFKEYRERVIERFGKDVDRELKYNIKAKEIEETVTDEKGNEKKVKTTVEVADPNLPSPYSKFFDEACPEWHKNPEYNLMFLRGQQRWANDVLTSRGYLFLNEVYQALGIPETEAGQVVGWIYDPDNPDHKGDNYVDFNIYDLHREKSRDFVNGYERSILLDFNVDGEILNRAFK